MASHLRPILCRTVQCSGLAVRNCLGGNLATIDQTRASSNTTTISSSINTNCVKDSRTSTLLNRRSAVENGLCSRVGRKFSTSSRVRKFETIGLGTTAFGTTSFHRVWMSKESGSRYPPRMILNRLMTHDDTHPTGMANAGVLLQLMEEAGSILCNNHCSTNEPGGTIHAVHAGLEAVEFFSTISVGEVIEIETQISFASEKSLQVLINLYATNVEGGGDRRHVGTAKYWYVPLRANDEQVQVAPPLKEGSVDEIMLKEGQESYQKMKELRKKVLAKIANPPNKSTGTETKAPGTVGYAEVASTTPSEPRFCWLGDKFVRGGFGIRWMDDVGALAATKHVKYPCLAVGVDSGIFTQKIYLGCTIQFIARPIHVTNTTIDVQVIGKRWSVVPEKGEDAIVLDDAIQAVFTYVSLDEKKNHREIPPLTFELDSDKELQEERKKYHETRQSKKKANS